MSDLHPKRMPGDIDAVRAAADLDPAAVLGVVRQRYDGVTG